MKAPFNPSPRGTPWRAFMMALPMLCLVALPLIALIFATTPEEFATGWADPRFDAAFWLSIKTSLLSLAIIVCMGTPLAWWLAHAKGRHAQIVGMLVDLPIILPPAVVGIGLLTAFGHGGLLGEPLTSLGLTVPFSTAAVVLSQVVVAAPFYIRSATASFQQLPDDLLVVARTLGHGPLSVFWRVAIPIAMPGVLSGATLSWARALGEFGATLLFAGSMPGVSQTMPIAIYNALESDVHVAIALSLVMAAAALVVLFALGLVFRTSAAPEGQFLRTRWDHR